jgi:hypothetical protein
MTERQHGAVTHQQIEAGGIADRNQELVVRKDESDRRNERKNGQNSGAGKRKC